MTRKDISDDLTTQAARLEHVALNIRGMISDDDATSGPDYQLKGIWAVVVNTRDNLRQIAHLTVEGKKGSNR